MSNRYGCGDGLVRAPCKCVLFAWAAIALCAPTASAAPSWVVTERFPLSPDPAAGLLTAIAVDAQGDSLVAGIVGNGSFAGLDSGQVTNAGQGARFVARYDALTGARRFVALIGSPYATGWRLAMEGFAVDATGNAYVPAFAAPLDFPVTGGTYVAQGAAYVYRVNPLGQVTRFSGPLDVAVRSVRALAVDHVGNVYLTGSADAGLATSPGAPYGTTAVAAGCIAPYASKLSPTGQTVYVTYLGYAGTQGERCGTSFGPPFLPEGYAITVDGAGNAYVTGQAEPGVRATPGAVNVASSVPVTVLGGPGVASHVFVTKLNATGTAITYSARIGGSGHDRGTAVVVDAAGNAYVAGKTTGYTFPRPGTAWPQVAVVRECLLGNPEIGFLAKLSADGSTLMWAGLLPVAGDELDECTLNGYASPLALASDGAGNLFTLGRTVASNRLTTLSRNALQPDDGDAHFAQVDANGQLLYSTWLSRGTDSLAADRAGNLRLAGDTMVQQLSPAALPVTVSALVDPACSGASTTLEARIAGAGSNGSVDFQVDGSSMGWAGVQGGVGTLALSSLAVGVRRVTVTYHGPGMFDGLTSSTYFLAVNQPGACS